MTKRNILYLLIVAASLTGGGYLIHDYRTSIPPDLSTGEPADLIAFMLSRHFARLSPEEQRKFTEEAMKRYATMTDAQRTVLEERVAKLRKENPEALRDQAMRVWKGFVVHEAEQYVQLPPEKRAAWIEAKVKQWKMMAPGGRGGEPPGGPEAEKRRKQREERENQPISAESQGKIVQFFQNDIMPRTTARERALVMALAKDAAHLMRPDKK